MQAKTIKLKLGNKYKVGTKRFGGDYWYTSPGSVVFNQTDMREALKSGDDLEFVSGKPELEFLGIIAAVERGAITSLKIDRFKQGDTDLLFRIIRAGGFIKYIEQLEETK